MNSQHGVNSNPQSSPSATTKSLEDILEAYRKNCKRRYTGYVEGGMHLSDKQALAAINNYTTQRVIEELEKLNDCCDSCLADRIKELKNEQATL